MRLATTQNAIRPLRDETGVGRVACGDQIGSPTLKNAVRILLVDGHAAARQAIAQYLANEPDFQILPPASGQAEALTTARQGSPSIAMISLELAEGDAFATAAAIQTISPGTRIIFLTAGESDGQLGRAVAAKAWAILAKQGDLSEFAAAIREVSEGGTFFSEEIHRRFVIGPEGVRLAEPGNQG